MLSSKEQIGYDALKEFLRKPLVQTDRVVAFYPGSADRIEHILELIPLLFKDPKEIHIHLVDPMIDESVLKKKLQDYPEIFVYAHASNVGLEHIPKGVNLYFERAFEMFRDYRLIEEVIKNMPENGILVSDGQIAHEELKSIPVPQDVKMIGFYPFFGIYIKNTSK